MHSVRPYTMQGPIRHGACLSRQPDADQAALLRLLQGEEAGGAHGCGGSWWWQADFPDYEATLGPDPCAALLQV